MLQVKIIDVFKARELEKEINNFLKDTADMIQVVDIKFNSYVNGDNEECHTALVMYRV